MIRKNILTVCLLLFGLSAYSQTAPQRRQVADQFNAWFMYFGSHKFSDKWGLHLEAQWRRSDFVSDPQQLLLRAGINYHISPAITATAGYGYIVTYPYGEQPAAATFPEHRIWEQLQFKNQFSWLEMVSRLRLEQRFVHSPVYNPLDQEYNTDESVYTNRFRIMQRFSVPFRGQVIKDKSLYLTAYDELMVNFGKNVRLNIFDQNRAYVALGYVIPKWGRFEVGYLNQMVFKPDGLRVENNHTLQVGLSSNLNFYNPK